jgi:hypothetical protein
MAMRRQFNSAQTVRRIGLTLAIVIGFAICAEQRVCGQSPPVTAPSFVTLEQLQRMSSAELEAIYQRGITVAIPAGPIRGIPLLAPGTRRSRILSRGARLIWQGKVIEPDQNSAVNRFFGMRVIRAQVYKGSSWLDGQPSLILDYSQTSRIYADNRDEIRQVAPGLYLGLMYDRTTDPVRVVLYFALSSNQLTLAN